MSDAVTGRNIRMLLTLWCSLTIAAAVAAEPATQHDLTYWRALKQSQFKLPPETSALPLAIEAAGLLGSTNSELRDDIGYEALATWVYQDQRLSPAELRQLLPVLTRNARQGLGREGDDTLFLRSFSQLGLSILAAQELRASFLDAESFRTLVGLGVRSLREERDLRGYVHGKGWGHATAHCADLLKFLARNPRLLPGQQAEMVAAIVGRLQTAGHVFTWGEDGRLAAALAAIVRRNDVDQTAFHRWFKALREEHEHLWGGSFDPTLYVRERTQLNTLNELIAELEPDTTPGSVQELRADLRALRADLR